jgi:calcineurin-like phosphoesterase family protein
MDEEIAKRWAATVGYDDLVFVLGDFSFGSKEFTASVLSNLPGRKVLVKGNHDTHSTNWYRDVGFYEVSKWAIIVDRFYILSHEPMYLPVGSPYANIHGHLHSVRLNSPNHFNVSVELHEYQPISLDGVEAVVRGQLGEGEDALMGDGENDEKDG